MSATAYRHIEIDALGVPHVAGTRTKVVEIALERLAHHWDAEEIRRQHPGLTLSQIHSALAYYYDHQEQIDADMDDRRLRADGILSGLGASPQRAKLVATKRGRQR